MKQCSKCKEWKKKSCFTKNKSKQDGLNHNCRECQRAYNRQHYQDNKQQYLDKARRNDKKTREEIDKITSEIKAKGCTDCKQVFHPVAMDFDHVRGEKVLSISEMRQRGWSLTKIRKEIAKCEVVCAVCHRIRTHQRAAVA